MNEKCASLCRGNWLTQSITNNLISVKLFTLTLTCYWVECWSTLCPGAESSSCGSSPDPPATAAWRIWCDSRWNGLGQTPKAPSSHGPYTQTPSKTPLSERVKSSQSIHTHYNNDKTSIDNDEKYSTILDNVEHSMYSCWSSNYSSISAVIQNNVCLLTK